MNEGVKFSQADLRHYWLTGFAHRRDFRPRYSGSQLVETKRSGGVFIQTDAYGAPQLRGDFAHSMDETTYDLCIPYARFEAAYNAMYKPEPETNKQVRLNYLHDTLSWWAFERNPDGVTFENFAERMKVNEKTVRRWLAQALRHIEREVTSPVVPMFYPESYLLRRAEAN